MPIGTILAYAGLLSKIPAGWHLCDGTNGTPNLIGRFLEGTASSIGIYKDAGLPNIYGEIASGGFEASEEFLFTGAFRRGKQNNGASGGYDDWGVIFDASLSNAIYGNSDTVQPASYTVYYIMKIRD